MFHVTLPDGKKLPFEQETTVHQVAEAIGPGLAKAALAGKVNGQLVDTSYVITEDTELAIVTGRDPDGLEVIRHSCAHLMAQAVKQLFPEAEVTIGPVIEDGFYYDFAYSRPFTPEDLTAIEKRMLEIAKQNLPVSRSLMSRPEAVKFFEKIGEKYKVQIIQDIPGDEELSFYTQGDFTDLCRGPHVPDTGKLKVFKLMKVAGAYWRGDAKNEMLQRIYGTAWGDKKELKAYLHRLEEAEKRDHRKLAKKYDLFHMQEEAPGMVFWHEKGWAIYLELQQYLRKRLTEHKYFEVNTPQLVNRELWVKSGHWEKFHDDIFAIPLDDDDCDVIKPMNCPCHVQIFNQGIKSYRDLPLRMAEFGSCHRNEPSGALHGLMRVRGFTQDDAHIFCTEDQIQSEVSAFIDLLYNVYTDLGFEEVLVRLSTRPEKRVGADEIWDKSEAALQMSIENAGLEYELQPGEGAFYGPKIEFSIKDCIGRVWQCGTMQLDFSMPERLGAQYVDEHGQRQVPVMLHRAILGSFERFIGILIEQTAGSFPTWLAPVQVAVMNITDRSAEYSQNVAGQLTNLGLRASIDLRNEKIGFKIREHTMQRVPYLLVLGDNEVDQQTVSVRTREGQDLGVMKLGEFIDKITLDIQSRGRNRSLTPEKNSSSSSVTV